MKENKDKFEEVELFRHFYKDGDQKWLGLILARYTLLLFGVCMKYLKSEAAAQDAVQQVFLKALMEIPKKKIINFGAWLYQVAKNECFSQLRTSKPFLTEESIVLLAQPEVTPEAKLWQAEKKREELSKALDSLKKEQKECILLFFFAQKSYNQISEETGYSIKQVKSHIQNGKRNLKIELAEFTPDKQKKECND